MGKTPLWRIFPTDLDGEDSCDDMSSGRYSGLESERKVDLRPVLSMANRVKETLRLEASSSKASSSSEQAAKKDEEVAARSGD